jgi:hypothetical protein
MGTLFSDINNDGIINGTDTTAPAGITVKITDKFGNEQTVVTDGAGQFQVSAVPAGSAIVSVMLMTLITALFFVRKEEQRV